MHACDARLAAGTAEGLQVTAAVPCRLPTRLPCRRGRGGVWQAPGPAPCRLFCSPDQRGAAQRVPRGRHPLPAGAAWAGLGPCLPAAQRTPHPPPPLLPTADATHPQAALFATTPLCLPWISLLFGGVVLALAQIQRLGGHPALLTVVQPLLAGAAVVATVLKLLLMGAAAARVPALAGSAGPAPSPAYLSDYVIAIVQLISGEWGGRGRLAAGGDHVAAAGTTVVRPAWASDHPLDPAHPPTLYPPFTRHYSQLHDPAPVPGVHERHELTRSLPALDRLGAGAAAALHGGALSRGGLARPASSRASTSDTPSNPRTLPPSACPPPARSSRCWPTWRSRWPRCGCRCVRVHPRSSSGWQARCRARACCACSWLMPLAALLATLLLKLPPATCALPLGLGRASRSGASSATP